MKELQTQRLLLRDFSMEDLDDFYTYCADPDVGIHAGWPAHQNKEQSEKVLRRMMESGEYWAVCERESGRNIGLVRLHPDERRKRSPQDALAMSYLLAKEQWGKMIERYLHTSKQLQYVFLLIDIRHEPSANDKMMYEWIVSNGFAPIIIATKLDKIKRSQRDKQLKLVRTGLGVLPGTKIIPFSAETKEGREEIWDLICAEPEHDGE